MIDAIVLKPMMYEGSDDVKLIVKPVAGQEKEGVSLWKEKVKIMTEAEYLQLTGGASEIVPEKSDILKAIEKSEDVTAILRGILPTATGIKTPVYGGGKLPDGSIQLPDTEKEIVP